MSTNIDALMTRMDVTRKGAERIAAIVETGVAILLEDGFTALTKRRIATRLGISHGNVSYYFPARESLWQAVIDAELQAYYSRHYRNFDTDETDPQARFDEFILRWIDEYRDRKVRIFFSQVLAFAEVNSVIATLRDDIYETFYDETMARMQALLPGESAEVLHPRVLAVMSLLEGLHAVTAFRPGLMNDGEAFREELRRQVNVIARGASGSFGKVA